MPVRAKRSARFARPSVVGLLTICLAVAASPALRANAATNVSHHKSSRACPWVAESRHHTASPTDLAEQVVAKMTLLEKARFVTLSEGHHIENFNVGIPSLCIPPLTLS